MGRMVLGMARSSTSAHRRHLRRWSVLASATALALAAACGSDDGGDAASVEADARSDQTATSEAGGAPPPGDCPLDAESISAVVGTEVTEAGDCDFAAGAAAGEAVTWSIELFYDPSIAEALTDGTPVEGIGDQAAWNDLQNLLYVADGSHVFQIQPLLLGPPPIELDAQGVAEEVAKLVVDRG
jgi:hypothetical protein